MRKSSQQSRQSAWLLVTGIVLLLYLVHFTLQAQKNPLRLDEVDYYQSMANVVHLGLPLYYTGEVIIDHSRVIYISTRRLGDQEFVFWRFKPETGILKETFFALVNGTSRYTFGMWHPPLYIYLGSFVFRLLPLTRESSQLLRYFNLVFDIGVFAGMFVLSRELYPTRHRKVFLLAAFLYALNSLAVRGSTLIDYNATMGPCVTIWFITTALRAERKSNLSWELTALTTLAFFTGLGIAVSLLVGLGTYCLLIKLMARSRRNFSGVMLSVASGIVVFAVSFLILCQLLQLPFSQPFLHNIARLKTVPRDLSIRRLSSLWTHLWWYCKEIGLIVVIAWALLSIRAVAGKVAYERLFAPVAIAVGLTSQAFLAANAYWFPKYVLFVLPLLFLHIAGEGTALASAHTRKQTLVTAVLLVLVLTGELDSLHWLLRPGSTLYNPGEQGLVQIAHTLQLATSSADIVLCRKDTGFFSHRRFIEWSGNLVSNENLLQTRVSEANVQYAVSRVNWLDPSTDIGEFLHRAFTIESKTGDFALLRRRGE